MSIQKQDFKIFVFRIFLLIIPLGCMGQKKPKIRQPAGLHEITGWDRSKVDDNNEAVSIDITGEVGHSLFVLAPTTKCISLSGDWTGYPKIISGKLPRGMVFDKLNRIKGVPTERGHYILKIEMNTIKCNDNSYKGISQVLRFHIMSKGCTIN